MLKINSLYLQSNDYGGVLFVLRIREVLGTSIYFIRCYLAKRTGFKKKKAKG